MQSVENLPGDVAVVAASPAARRAVYAAVYSVQMVCRLLGVPSRGFYVWEDRPPSQRSRYDLYQTGKIHAELSDDHGIHLHCKRVARLMRAAHLQACSRIGL
jgi:hypothetical protein